MCEGRKETLWGRGVNALLDIKEGRVPELEKNKSITMEVVHASSLANHRREARTNKVQNFIRNSLIAGVDPKRP
ncbi:hypothetical protein OnM2_071062 [Erysiphe neolycopersici]|uniref:Uncharacterized protein n=1 Tax=Erysiphe neolycopersici TaxID=212602 RepID=A0A420HKA3_9PEZI|nr:hypothetical protein OnM2_071062 [Erysiphe neolycopersici]